MRVLLDECVPSKLKRCFPGHAVQTVPEVGWRSSKDRSLLEFASKNFDVFLTIDRSIEHQHDISAYAIGFVIVRVRSNRFVDFEPMLDAIQSAIQNVRSGNVMHVP